MSRLHPAAVATLVVAAAGLLVGCGAGTGTGAGTPWWYHPGVTTCGPPAQVRVGGRAMFVGSCAGILNGPAPKVTVHTGEEIDVHMTQEPAGPTGNQLVPILPLPRSSRPSVVRPGATSSDRATGIYWAVRPGHSVLMSRAGPILDVTVVP